jgi:hypothetical protein
MGGAELGDARRTARLVRTAERVAQSPGGRVTDVFRDLAERQGSYDLLESDHITHEKVTETGPDPRPTHARAGIESSSC